MHRSVIRNSNIIPTYEIVKTTERGEFHSVKKLYILDDSTINYQDVIYLAGLIMMIKERGKHSRKIIAVLSRLNLT